MYLINYMSLIKYYDNRCIMTNKEPKYPCNALDCPNKQSDIFLAEERLLYSENLCDDPGCANIQDKHILDLKDGLRNLEHILCTMTQLCTEPECLAKTASLADRTPCPIVPCKTEATVLPTPKCDKPLKGYEKVAKELRELRALCNAGVCKSPACYNAYMGYNKNTGIATFIYVPRFIICFKF